MTPVSLVITSYNRDRYLAAAIQSVLDQTHPNFELLVWDDGSTDRSVAVAQTYAQKDPRIRVIAAPHQGLSRSLSQAIASTTHHPYLGWVDSDDQLAPTALAETVAILDAQPQAGMVYTDYSIINAEGELRGKGRHCQIPYSPQRLLVEFITFHFRLLRRSLYEQVGGVDPTFERAEDYDLCLRLSEVTEFVHLPRPLYFYRQHEGNVTHDDLEMLRWTHRASTQALERRGLADRYEIRVRGELTLQLKPESLPLVSIIIPCYNAEKTIETCLRSCFEQSYSRLEIVVVNNNSTDGTAAQLAQQQAVASCSLRMINCSTQGANPARIEGLRQAQGDYIQWLDADDQLAPDKIQRQVMALERDSRYDLAYGDWQWCVYAQQRLIYRQTFVGEPHTDWLLQCLMDNWQPPHSYLWRRQAADRLQTLSAWHPQTPVTMDREYVTQAALAGMQPLYVPESRVAYNMGLSPSQITRSTPYAVRVQSLCKMFERFRQQAAQNDGLEPAHLFLLNQSWELWQPNFELIGQAEQVYWIRHHETEARMMLRDAAARVVQTWLTLPGAYTLEDQARRIVLQLWRETVVSIRQTSGLKAALDAKGIAHALAQVVGLIAGASECRPVPTTDLELEPELVALMQGCPLYTPLFGEHRLKVHTVLDSLRQQGWLNPPRDAEVLQSSAPQSVD